MHKFLQWHQRCLRLQEEQAAQDAAKLRALRLQKMKDFNNVGRSDEATEHRPAMETLFEMYCSLTCGGKKLMRRPDWARFLHDFHEAHPKVKGFKNVDPLMKIWEDYIELQKDLCATYDMERSEAAKGLCFECFQGALHSAIPASFYHQSY